MTPAASDRSRDKLDLQVPGQARDGRTVRHAVRLVTVIETWGSVPRPPGALLALFDRPSEDIARLHGPIAAKLLAVRNAGQPTQKKPGSALHVAAVAA